jgi:hypothetical protein
MIFGVFLDPSRAKQSMLFKTSDKCSTQHKAAAHSIYCLSFFAFGFYPGFFLFGIGDVVVGFLPEFSKLHKVVSRFNRFVKETSPSINQSNLPGFRESFISGR